MSMEIIDKEVGIRDISMVCGKISTNPKDIQKMQKIISKIEKLQEKIVAKNSKVPYERLEGLSEEQIMAYTKALHSTLEKYQKTVEKITSSKKTKEIFFKVKANPDGSMTYSESDEGRKASTIVDALVSKAMANSRRDTVNRIRETNKAKYYGDVSKRIEQEAEKATVEANEKKGRNDFYTNLDNAHKIDERKTALKGSIGFVEKMAQETYGNTAAAYRMSQIENKTDKDRLTELEGR